MFLGKEACAIFRILFGNGSFISTSLAKAGYEFLVQLFDGFPICLRSYEGFGVDLRGKDPGSSDMAASFKSGWRLKIWTIRALLCEETPSKMLQVGGLQANGQMKEESPSLMETAEANTYIIYVFSRWWCSEVEPTINDAFLHHWTSKSEAAVHRIGSIICSDIEKGRLSLSLSLALSLSLSPRLYAHFEFGSEWRFSIWALASPLPD